jgi:20S proteasome alpha/beta subunit
VQDGAAVGCESKSNSPLAERGTNLKVQEITPNVGCVYSGLGTDSSTSVLPSNAS